MKRIFLTLMCAVSAVAAAQPLAAAQSFELERLSLNASAGASLATSTGDGLEAGRFRVALLGHYQHEPLVALRDTGETIGAIVGYRVTSELLAAFAPAQWLEVGLHLPVVLAQGGDELTGLGFAPTAGAGLGTPSLYARALFLRQANGAPLDLSAQLGLALSLGTAAFANDGQVWLAPRIGAGRAFGWFRVGAELSAEVRPARSLGGQSLGHTLGAALTLSTVGAALRGELTGRTQFSVAPSAVASGDVLLGLRYALGDFELFALGGPGFGAAMGTPVFRALGGLAWAPRFSSSTSNSGR